ncbi:MAG: CYTH domain-containing protein [Lachnospiraceae bacterium]|nr:CYTH domain-containing protein [Lachnospiraceae bacterium]
MEIERKFIPKYLPENIATAKFHKIEQAYLNTSPVVRIRQSDNDYYLTYKGGGMMAREEYNLPLNKESYIHLREKADGNIITKTRYLIPIHDELTAELDIFEGVFKGLMIVEVEFESIEQANTFTPPDWFGEDVTTDGRYHNSYLSKVKIN